MEYADQIKALRQCANGRVRIPEDCMFCPYDGNGCAKKLKLDTANSIEELMAQVNDKEHLIQQQADEIERLRRDVKKQQEKMIELAKGLPKRGEWIEDRTEIVCSKCHARFSDEIIFMNRNMENEALKYCPNCGAKMMEVQDDKA